MGLRLQEEVVCTLGLKMHELDKSLKIISVSGDSLLILGTSAVFIKTQVTGKKKTLLQCAVLRRNKNPEILVSLENMKKLGRVHPTFGPLTNLYLISTILAIHILKDTRLILFNITNQQSQISKRFLKKRKSFLKN